MTRVLHLGNVANNGYINAKLLRRAGIEADALVDEWHILSQPEWEDAPLTGATDPVENLAVAAAEKGWQRPDWVIARRNWDPGFAKQSWLGERVRTAAALPQVHRLYRRLLGQYVEVADVQGTGPLRFMDVLLAWVWLKRMEHSFEPLPGLFSRYDLVQGYAIHPILSVLATPRMPYVAFEHGTMREEPFRDSWQGRLLALAYRRAAKIIITNPDVIAQAAQLGLEDYVFIPHPIDEAKYTPGPSELRAELEADGFDFVLLCPSRHDWDI
jgi:hypothetical protein